MYMLLYLILLTLVSLTGNAAAAVSFKRSSNVLAEDSHSDHKVRMAGPDPDLPVFRKKMRSPAGSRVFTAAMQREVARFQASGAVSATGVEGPPIRLRAGALSQALRNRQPVARASSEPGARSSLWDARVRARQFDAMKRTARDRFAEV